ncbi:MAG: protein kinase [Thermodesulfobacteriota bacterium]|nr:protein kinase [Thermodesulfobacteriota bacterium]
MKAKKERRKWPRQTVATWEVAIIFPQHDKDGPHLAPPYERDTWVVQVLNRSQEGFLLKSPLPLRVGALLHMKTRLAEEEVWIPHVGKVVHGTEDAANADSQFVGVELMPQERFGGAYRDWTPMGKKGMSARDLEFFMGTKLFDALSDEAKCYLLNSMKQLWLEPGERLIEQGTYGDTLYVIQQGTCVVNVEKDGIDYPVARSRAGDILGEVALFTGGTRSAHVDAETDVKLWSMTKEQFEALCEGCGDVQDFLTEVITRRLSREWYTAERNVGKYVINEIIGQGGWSIVYKGMHKHLNMPVAIKMLKHDMAMDPDFSEKFRNEAKTIAQFNHENIVKVYDIEELYRTIFIITEYLEGVPLDYLLKKAQKLPLSRALDILLQICAGLSYAHDQGIVHQDIKPANIFIQPNDRVKIIDFGLACPPGAMDCGLKGTIFYAAPEAIDGESGDERADIFSLGITAFEMITGKRPFAEDDIARVIESRLCEDIPDVRGLRPNLPDELCEFIQGATQRDPVARYQNVSQAARVLEPLAERMAIKRQARLREKRKMMSLSLLYHEQDESALKGILEGFSHALDDIGAELQAAKFDRL